MILPFVLAAIILPLVAWRTSGQPRPVLISEILASGLPSRAEIVTVRPLGSILDLRPMVRFVLHVRPPVGGEAFELEVIQSFPRSVVRQFKPGDDVDVRLTPDLTQGAVVWNDFPPGF